MDSFWFDIKHVKVDVICLLKVKAYCEEFKKIEWKIKRKKLRKMSTSSLIKKLALKRFDEHLLSFKFMYGFSSFCSSKFPDFDVDTLLKISKGGGVFRTGGSVQACQHESVVCDLVKPEELEKEIISSTENTPDIKEKHATVDIRTIATFKRERLKGKFVNNSIIDFLKEIFHMRSLDLCLHSTEGVKVLLLRPILLV